MSFFNWVTLLKRLSFVRRNSRTSRRRSQFTSQTIQLEDRCLLSFTPVLQSTVGSLDQVLYTLSTSTPQIPSNIPLKFVTIMNNSPNIVYPILIDANSTQDNTRGQVVRLTLTDGGGHYDPAHPPKVEFKGGNGSGASAQAAVNAAGQVYALTLGLDNLPVGSGFTSAPNISFDDSANGDKGTGAAATATISVAGSYTKPMSQYDPLDPLNQGYRGYIGEVDPNNPNQVDAGLQPYSQVTIQLPLVFWDGARIFMATNGTGTLQSATDPGNPIQSANPWQYNLSAAAYMPAPGTPYSATFPDPSTGVPNSSGRVLWYHDSNVLAGGPKGFANDTPGQLTEYTIRDPLQVTWAPDTPQSELANPILNYDVSYVDQLGLPAMMETTDGYPKTDPQIGTKPYAGIGADLSVPQMQQLIAAFTQSVPGAANSLLGQYFGGKGYDAYTFPGSLSTFDLLPGGFNVFADSALADSESTYNTASFQQFKLLSGGSIDRVATGNINGNGVVTVGSNVVTGLDPSVVKQLVPGMIVLDSGSGPGGQGNYFSAGTSITSVDLVNNTVTLSTPAYFPNSGNGNGTFALTFLGSQWSSSAGSTDGTNPQITGLDPNAVQYLTPGMLVTGPGISGYARIQSINSPNVVNLIDQNGNPVIPTSGSGSSGSPYVFSGGPSSYVASKLIDLWYAWADYYVQNAGATNQSMSGTTTGTNNLLDGNALILSGLSDTSPLKVGDVVSGPNIAQNRVSDVQVLNSGSGYQAGDILTVAGGATIAPFGAAMIKVIGVNGSGALTAVQVMQGGSYSTIPSGPAGVTGGHGSGATFNLTISNTTITNILSATSVQLSNAVLTSATGTYMFAPPLPMPRSSDAPAFGDPTNTLTFNGAFTAPYGETPLAFAQTVYDVMSGFSKIPPSGAKLSLSAQLLSYCIGCNIGSFAGNSLVPVVRQNQLRDELKSIMRGVSDFQTFPEFGTIQNPVSTSQWYPNPATALTGALLDGSQTSSNVFNLNPYVFFVHKVLGMNGYGFSVDDDTADVGSLGSNLQIAFGSTSATAPGTTQKLQNQNYFTSGAPYGTLLGQGQIDNTSVAFANIRANGFTIPGNATPTPVTVIRLPTSLIPRLVAADQNVSGALATASDNSLPAGTRVVAFQNSVSDPAYPAGFGAVFVSRPAGAPPTTDGPPNINFTFTGFNTLLPVVTGFSQSSALPGTQITITGAQFGYTPVGSVKFFPVVLSVTFDGIPAAAGSITVINADILMVTVPPGATKGKVAVRSDAGTGYSSSDFTIGVGVGIAGTAPTLLSASPASGSLGQKITLSGTGFLAGNVSITFNGVPVLGFDPVISDTTIAGVIVPDFGATSGTIVVTTANGPTTETVTYSVNAPNITNSSATTGPVGTPFTLTGTGFTGVNSATGVTINGVPATKVQVLSDTMITGVVAVGTATGATTISVTTSGGTGNTPFTVTAAVAPSITSFSPGSGVVGATITLTGNGFLGAASVTFGGVPAGHFSVNDDTSIVVTVPALAATGPIVVTNAAGPGTSATNFTVTPTTLPVITSFTPTSGAFGTQVQIKGSGFTNVSDVEFHGQPADFLVINDTLIECEESSGSATGLISVTNTAGTTFSSTSFVVGVLAPDITSANSATFPVFSLNGTYTSSTTLTVTNASQLSNGMFVNGPGVAPNTTITVNGNTVTLSQASSQSIGSGIFVFAGSSFQVTSTNATSLKVVGNLPVGVIFTDIGNGTGTIAGAPAFDIRNLTFQIVASSSTNPAQTATQIFTLTVSSPPLLTVTVGNMPATSANYVVGAANNPVIKLAASPPFGTKLATTLTVSGLPKGVAFKAGAGTISGTPPAGAGGVYPIIITAHNVVGSTVQNFTLTVNQAPPSFLTAASTVFTVGKAGTFIVRATGYPTLPTLTSALPPGEVTFSSIPNVSTTGTSQVGSPTVAVASSAGIQVGMGVTGPGIANGTTVTSTSGNTVTLSTGAIMGAGVGNFNFGGIAMITSTSAATAMVKSFVITATIGTKTAAQTFKLTIEKPALAITSAAKSAFQQGATGTFTVTATGSPTPTLSIVGTLPGGGAVTFTDNHDGTATMTGIPLLTDAGKNFPIIITATIGTTKVKQAFTLSVVNYTQAAGTVAIFTTGKSGTATIGGSFPAGTTFTAINGKLPPGVTLARSKAGSITVSGKPPAGSGGSYSFQIASNNSQSAVSPVYTILVNQPQPVITSIAKATFTVGQAGSFKVTTTGFPFPAIEVSGNLPVGLVFTSNIDGTATLTGTPKAGTGGTYNVTLGANNGIGTGIQQFVLTVLEPPVITSANSNAFTLGSLSSFLVTTTGSPAPVLTVTGALPAGITFAPKGKGAAELRGTPTKSGTFRFFLIAMSGTFVSVQEFTLTVQ